MPINKDIEGDGTGLKKDVTEPLIEHRDLPSRTDALWMVLLSTFVAVSGSFEFGSCVGYSAPTQLGIMKDLGLSISQYSIFGSILSIGAMIGAVTSGRIADFIGRKGAMRMASIICIVGWLMICLAMGDVSLDTGRFLNGYGIGILSYVVPVFIAEITPQNLRGTLATANQLLIVVGIAVSFTVGAFVGWRTLAFVGIIPCIVQLVGLTFIPESPRWLAKVGRYRDFEAALRQLRGKDADISEEEADIQNYIMTLQLLPKVSILDLFQRRYIRPVTVGVGLMVFQQFGGINGIVFYAGHIFISAGFPPNVGTILYAVIQVTVTAIGVSLVDKAGRRPLLLCSASGLLLGSTITGISFFLKAHNLLLSWVPLLAVVGVLVYIGSFSIGMGAVPWVIMSEVFPINIKATGGSLVTLVNWFGSSVVSYTFNFLMSWSSYGTFFVYACICAIGIVFIYSVVPETKGRSLEDIQSEMTS